MSKRDLLAQREIERALQEAEKEWIQTKSLMDAADKKEIAHAVYDSVGLMGTINHDSHEEQTSQATITGEKLLELSGGQTWPESSQEVTKYVPMLADCQRSLRPLWCKENQQANHV